jgi:hypothetical protein
MNVDTFIPTERFGQTQTESDQKSGNVLDISYVVQLTYAPCNYAR